MTAGWDCHVHVFDSAASVRPGHYVPPHRPLEAIEATAGQAGIGHLVLVQPSVYGSDNSVLLAALASRPDRPHRGVVVLSGKEDAATLDAMHALGVRGVRFNLMSPVGEAGGEAQWAALGQRVRALAPRLRERGWHCQWYLPSEALIRVAELHEETALPCVLDHLASQRADVAPSASATDALARLAAMKSHLKFSGLYRLGAVAPYGELREVAARSHALFAPRLLFGSDWPHTSFAPEDAPPYRSLVTPTADLLPLVKPEQLNQAALALYQ